MGLCISREPSPSFERALVASSPVLLSYFTTLEARTLRCTSRLFLEIVTEYDWEDDKSVIRGSLVLWRRCFPCARAANVGDRRDVDDTALIYLKGRQPLKKLRIAMENLGMQNAITNKAFHSLVGIHTLNMRNCRQHTITDAAFLSLVGIHTLNMSGCSQRTITNKAFLSLVGIHTLNMSECWQFTDISFLSLVGIHTLDMSWCFAITDKAFCSLVGIHTLTMIGCGKITDAAFLSLAGIHALNMGICNAITDNAFLSLAGIHTLRINRCAHLRGVTLHRLQGLKHIDVRGSSPWVQRAAREQLMGVDVVDDGFIFYSENV